MNYSVDDKPKKVQISLIINNCPTTPQVIYEDKSNIYDIHRSKMELPDLEEIDFEDDVELNDDI